MREIFVSPDRPPTQAELQDGAIAVAAEKYRADEMSESDFIEFLAGLDYLPSTPGDYTDVFTDVPGSFDTIIRLHSDKVISDDTYEGILNAFDKRDASS